MMINQFGAIKHFLPEKLKHLRLIASILLLLLPCYSWFLVRSYQTTIQIPREWEQFKAQEEQIIQALREFRINNHKYPERLSLLVPEYLNTSIWKSEKWSFHYGMYENGEYFLSATVPKSWFGWPARRSCRSQQDGLVECSFQLICGYRKGSEILTKPIGQESPVRQLWRGPQANPCSSQD